MTTQWIKMSDAQFQRYAAHSGASYAEDIQLTYNYSPDRVSAKGNSSMHELLPDGVQTPDQHLFTLQDLEGHEIGFLWFGTYTDYGVTTLFIYDLEIFPQAQRRGHATETLRMTERWALANGVSRLELNVFAHNHAAQALYRANGLMVCEITMGKQLA